ncbi:MAG: hypothetical protein MJ252_02545 [archaeon]|nr:hypothetical protein [archaeon]
MPLSFTQQMKIEEFIALGKFNDNDPTFENSLPFIYDINTAIPYQIINFSRDGKMNYFKGDSNVSTTDNTKPEEQNEGFQSTFKKKKVKLEKQNKFLFIVLNDFFDSFTEYKPLVNDIIQKKSSFFSESAIVYFNYPGQSCTMWSSESTLNNIFYAEFLDHFLTFLYTNKVFDFSWNIILLGFGNGGYIALTYASLYEKYSDYLHTIIIYNSYCENESYLNKSMSQIMNVIKKTNNPKKTKEFIYNITKSNSKETNKLVYKKNGNEEYNPITLLGYKKLCEGYYMNLKINLDCICTKIIAIHSNQNNFISIRNLNSLFFGKLNIFSPTEIKKEKQKEEDSIFKGCEKTLENFGINTKTISEHSFFDFDEFKKEIKRKIIIFEGTHNFSAEKINKNLQKVLVSYFIYLKTNKYLITKVKK